MSASRYLVSGGGLGKVFGGRRRLGASVAYSVSLHYILIRPEQLFACQLDPPKVDVTDAFP